MRKRPAGDRGKALGLRKQGFELSGDGLGVGCHQESVLPIADPFREGADAGGEHRYAKHPKLAQGVGEALRDACGNQGEIGGDALDEARKLLALVIELDVNPAQAEETHPGDTRAE